MCLFLPSSCFRVQWVPISLGWLARVIAMSVAYTAQRILSAFHSAVRGSQVIAHLAFAPTT